MTLCRHNLESGIAGDVNKLAGWSLESRNGLGVQQTLVQKQTHLLCAFSFPGVAERKKY